jgi:regulator of cell morphogenesis and NO signaling
MIFEVYAPQYYRNQIEKRFEEGQISNEFNDLLEQAMKDPEAFDAELFEGFELEEVFTYLKASHQYYQDIWIPKIENTLLQMRQKYGSDYWSVRLLVLFVNSYKKELQEHIEEEEKVLFSFVEKLLRGEQCPGHQDLVLNHFIHTHNDNVVIQLEELRKDILTFDGDLRGNLMFEVLFNQLSVFQRDLMVHGLIEDHVFVGKVVEYTNRN